MRCSAVPGAAAVQAVRPGLDALGRRRSRHRRCIAGGRPGQTQRCHGPRGAHMPVST